MKRRELREHIFEILFRVEFMNEADMEEQMELFFEDLAEARPADVEYIKNKYARKYDIYSWTLHPLHTNGSANNLVQTYF